MNLRGSLSRLMVACAWIAACGSDDPDAVSRVEYSPLTLERHVLRRVRLTSAGVPLRGELAADSVWWNVLGYTFIARRPEGEQSGIRSVRALRDGVPLRGSPGGISRTRPRAYRLDEGYRFVDVFDEWSRHLGTVVVDTAMGSRRILQHLGHARPQSGNVDRHYLSVKGVVLWRSLLTEVLRSGGYGPLYQRRPSDVDGKEPPSAAGDTLRVMAERYELDELTDFTLVGRNGCGEHYRHIFAAGGRYLMTAVCYGEKPLDAAALLRGVGLVADARAAAGTD